MKSLVFQKRLNLWDRKLFGDFTKLGETIGLEMKSGTIDEVTSFYTNMSFDILTDTEHVYPGIDDEVDVIIGARFDLHREIALSRVKRPRPIFLGIENYHNK